jgi:hypothetical protein
LNYYRAFERIFMKIILSWIATTMWNPLGWNATAKASSVSKLEISKDLFA